MRWLRPRWRGVTVILGLLVIILGVASPALADGPSATRFFGIQMGDSVAEQGTLPEATSAGIQWIRMNLRWDQIEPTQTDPPTYRWNRYDTLIGNATTAGFALIITVRDNPDWAATTACGPIDKVPVDRYLAFLSTLVGRYSQAPYNVKMWELYNEPDNNSTTMPELGGCWGQHADQYAALLGQARPVVQAADPSGQSRLVLGGLAHDYFDVPDGGPFNPNFLPALLSNPGGTSFDVMNFHYYRAFDVRWNAQGGPSVIGKVTYIRGQLTQRGLSRPIIVTEIGHPSAGPASDNQDYSDATSSRFVVQSYARGIAAGLESMIWFEMVDGVNDPRKYGLLTSEFTPKAAYLAYETLTRELDVATYVRNGSFSGLESYVFDVVDREKTVAWSTDQLTHTLTLNSAVVWDVDKLGSVRSVVDGSAQDRDGNRNGVVAVDVGIEPRYVYPRLPGDLPVKGFLPVSMRAH